MIDKPSIVVTSLGRTGTKFFSLLFGGIIPDCASFHEPDLVQYFGTKDRMREFLKRVRDAGVYYMVFQKLLGRWTLIKVSDSRLRGELTENAAAAEVLRQRRRFVESKKARIYVESNAGYYGLIDVLSQVFTDHRVIFMVRDGRAWISSEMNVGELYGKRGIRGWFSHKMPSAKEFPADPLWGTWDSLSRFERLCWAWAKLNEYAVSTIAKNSAARLFQFEKIFEGPRRYAHFNELVDFATSLPGVDRGRIGSTEGWLERRVHQSSNQFPSWKDWTTDQKAQFARICGPLMDRLGYEYG